VSFRVERIEAEKFSKVWNKSGIQILLTPESIDFAADFANVVLNNFIKMCEENAKVQQKLEEAAKPKLIVEGVY
jgi:hypothetical protein